MMMQEEPEFQFIYLEEHTGTQSPEASLEDPESNGLNSTETKSEHTSQNPIQSVLMAGDKVVSLLRQNYRKIVEPTDATTQEPIKLHDRTEQHNNEVLDVLKLQTQDISKLEQTVFKMLDELKLSVEQMSNKYEVDIGELRERVNILEQENARLRRENVIELNQHLRKREPVPFQAERFGKMFGDKTLFSGQLLTKKFGRL